MPSVMFFVLLFVHFLRTLFLFYAKYCQYEQAFNVFTRLGRLAWLSYEHIFICNAFLKEGEISPPYEQALRHLS